MAEKKGKALALELMDDLLGDDAATADAQVEDTSAPQQKEFSEAPAKPESFDFADISSDDETSAAEEGSRTDISETADHAASHSSPPPVPDGEDDDHTMRIAPPTQAISTHGEAEDRVRASVGRFGAFRSPGPTSATEAALAQSESLRIAQNRLLEFEQEIERLRLQNEQLAAAGETLRRRTDELTAANQKRENDYQFAVSTFRQEKDILNGSKEALQRDLEQMRQKNDELDLRISTNIQKIRVRERELENRLELMKMESAALVRSKDELILDLKRQIDQLNLELNNYRNKNQELNRQTTDKQEMLRRTVKALRLALSMLEGEEEAPKAATPLRKAK